MPDFNTILNGGIQMSMGSTYFRKDGRWEARLCLGTFNGKRQSKSVYGKTKEEAQNKLLLEVMGASTQSVTEMTVKELCVEWLQVSQSRVKRSTLANYRMKIEKHIIPQFGDKMCSDLTSVMAYTFMQKKLDSGLSPRYVTDIMVLLKTIFKYAQLEHGVFNPFVSITMPKCAKKEVRLLSANEQKKLKSYLKEHQNSVTIGITLALAMGLRIGEVCGLMWEDIDVKKRILTVRRTVQRIPVNDGSQKTAVIVSSPKSQTSAREIPIPAGVFVMLKNMKSADDHYILSDDAKPVEPRKIQYQFARILKNAGLPSVTFHSLRHAMASNAIDLGFDVKTLSEILGHSRIELTMNLYVHSDMDRKRRCMDKIKWAV
uniref:Integrase family protein n=1 Tax=uncultured bacterium Contigcl_1787 TaxID=1393662 RepID=W0FRR2_9BACT|nr:integrase family protein [uncultured bacterium Contigcl_1787]